MSKQQFVMLAHDFVPGKHRVSGQFFSEKLDGIRAIWDGGVTRGMEPKDVPWCNCAKHDRFVNVKLRATGLWSRYCQPIQAPDWWLDQMPKRLLDGELWLGHGRWEELCSAVQTKTNATFRGYNLDPVQMICFDSPPSHILFKDRIIDIPNLEIQLKDCIDFFESRADFLHFKAAEPFVNVNSQMIQFFREYPQEHCKWLDQVRLPHGDIFAQEKIEELNSVIIGRGGEGGVIRQLSASWVPERTYDLLKVKAERDAEATVVGYTWGKKTDKGSKLLGMMGSLKCQLPGGKIFDLSGFTEEERKMAPVDGNGFHRMEAMAETWAGQEAMEGYHNPKFPRGGIVSFKYREMTKDGLPKEARFWRQHKETP